MRQVVLDTETTGLSPSQGHRIIEIGCLEMIDRRMTGREFHCFLHPDREIDEAAQRVHGISLLDLETAPRFAEIADEFLDFIASAELVIHNAEFDVGFLEYELSLMGHAKPKINQHATVLDTLSLARKLHPGQRNSLDALCKRYEVDASTRDVHGAIIDSELLARVYLAMTGGQTVLSLDAGGRHAGDHTGKDHLAGGRHEGDSVAGGHDGDQSMRVIRATAEEIAAHEALLQKIARIRQAH
ncbi:MAG: DNA polymerase III subunit epsilon [Gammaproteobacteria bacterium]|nr:DNA polymerase III subunit epsilon [Gammaproteobacteria bacterium]